MKSKNPEIVNLKDEIINLYNTEYLSSKKIGEKFNINPYSISYHLKKWGVKKRSLSESHNLKFDKTFFDKIDTEEKAYFLGFIAADGNVHKKTFQICIHPQDEEILIALKKCLVADYKIRNDRKYKRFSITSEYFSNALKCKGILENKTFLLQFPSEEIVPKNLIRHYLRGYFDGDGCITFSTYNFNKLKWKFQIISNYDFVIDYAKQLNYLILREAEPSIYKEKRRENPIYYFSIGSTNLDILQKIYNLFYIDSNIYLSRKKRKMETILSFNE